MRPVFSARARSSAALTKASPASAGAVEELADNPWLLPPCSQSLINDACAGDRTGSGTGAGRGCTSVGASGGGTTGVAAVAAGAGAGEGARSIGTI